MRTLPDASGVASANALNLDSNKQVGCAEHHVDVGVDRPPGRYDSPRTRQDMRTVDQCHRLLLDFWQVLPAPTIHRSDGRIIDATRGGEVGQPDEAP